jgi:hypothetical protein
MALFDPLTLDAHKPPVLKPSLAQWDNYQIYTLVCRDITQTVTTKKFVADESIDPIITPAGQYAIDVSYIHEGEYGINNQGQFLGRDNNPLTGIYADISDRVITNKLSDFLAIQTFNPCKPKVNFLDYVDGYSASADTTPKFYLTYGNLETVELEVPQNLGTYTNQSPPNTGVTANPRFGELFKPNYSNLNGAIIGKISDTTARGLYNAYLQVNFWDTVGYGTFWNFYRQIIDTQIPKREPNYIDLLDGYEDLLKPNNPHVVPTFSGELSIGYYRPNRLEPILGLRSIDWIEYQIEVTKDRPIYLPIKDVVLGTLWISNPTIASQIRALPTIAGGYTWGDLFPENVDPLFTKWRSQYNEPLPTYSGDILIETIYSPPIVTVRRLGANNDVWHNGTTIDDAEIDLTHPMFEVDESRTIDYHFIFNQDTDSLGRLVMDSPKIVELWTHFCSQYPVLNDIDNDLPRVNTHGYYLTKIAHLLGHRVNANGEVDLRKEAEIVPQLLNKPRWKQGDTSYSQYAYGKKGLVVPSLPTSYDRQGRLLEQYHICHDIPQLLAALHSDIDKSLGIEQGSQIRVKGLDGKIVPFQNQLALAIDNQQRVQIMSERIEKLYGMNLVQSQELRGLYSGIGIPTSVEKLPVLDVKGKIKTYLPYHTHQQSQSSILGHLTAIKMNLSIALGTLMPKAENKSLNPFKRFQELAGSVKPKIKWLKGK